MNHSTELNLSMMNKLITVDLSMISSPCRPFQDTIFLSSMFETLMNAMVSVNECFFWKKKYSPGKCPLSKAWNSYTYII